MSVADMFSGFVQNLTITNRDIISQRYGELTSALNQHFRDTDSETDNSLQVGSFGRRTAINGISDLDMLYIMPKRKWGDYDKDGGQRKLLEDARDAIRERFSDIEVRVDRLVVTVTYTDFRFEVQPVFEQEDQSYKFPDTKGDGSWRITRPREEMDAIAKMDTEKNGNLRNLCKMARAWKDANDVEMGGLLLDTLAYNFLESTTDFDYSRFSRYDTMSRDFLKYLSEEPDHLWYAAPGSGQHVKVKKRFQGKAKKAYALCLEAIGLVGDDAKDKWKEIYGEPFVQDWENTEQFIEDKFSVNIQGTLKLDCEVTQRGFRLHLLSEMLRKHFPLLVEKDLRFYITSISVEKPYDIYWKVLNRGEMARKKNCIRGKIDKDEGRRQKIERTCFRGDHFVECYCVKNGVVVARGRIIVPIVDR